ncbi:TraB/GumN family protein [Gallaecimonas sp. GXIMD4217]|uniref:TraB/GumN family protein n=1 Tax=Gallaecimonas sp. GXIMD4217 TaxID=3131927 RepID=UPI00311AEC07
MQKYIISLILLIVLAPLPSNAAPALWQVGSPQGQFLLLGSIHVGKQSTAAELEAILARHQVDKVVMEVSPATMDMASMQQAMARYGLLPPGQSLDGQLSPTTWTLFKNHSQAVGLPWQAMQQQRPWLAALGLMQQALQQQGFRPELGTEMQLLTLLGDRDIAGLESLERQYRALASIDRYADTMLEETLKEIGQLDQQLSPLLQAWHQGDIQALKGLCPLAKGAEPAVRHLHEETLAKRNREWLPRLKALDGKNTLVVVGMAHIICEDGLLEMLRGQQLEVERLQ